MLRHKADAGDDGGSIRVTDARFIPGDGVRVLARVSVVFDEMVVVHGMALVPGREGGLYLAMPKHEHKDGTKRDTVHPISKDARSYIEGEVLSAYRAWLEGGAVAAG